MLTSALCVLTGGAERDRTDDLLLAKQALSQLSYSPFRFAMLCCSASHVRPCTRRGLAPRLTRDFATLCWSAPRASIGSRPAPSWALVGLDGFEPSTPALSRRCSNQLSYRPVSGITSPLANSKRQQPISVGTWKRLGMQVSSTRA